MKRITIFCRPVRGLSFIVLAVLAMLPAFLPAAVITDGDSTQPRGEPLKGAKNDQGQLLDPIIDGFRSPAYRAGIDSDSREAYFHWSGSMMGNTIRDPSFFAALSVANKDLINYIKSLPGQPKDASSPLGSFLKANGLEKDIYRAPDGSLQPEGLLPVTGDFCLRCHTPPGWLEGRSEPPTKDSPFLKGQFWGAAFLEQPIDVKGAPRAADMTKESEAEMDGVQCDSCHRTTGVFMRKSRFDGSAMAAGNGGYVVDRSDPFAPSGRAGTVDDFQLQPDFCGACHDVTNPLLKTRTKVNGSTPDMYHPIERTYTEWYWSAYREEWETCQSCHEPMKFSGAQTWLLYPGLDRLWGAVDQRWVDRGYRVPASRTEALKEGMGRNRKFMGTDAATVEFVETPKTAGAGEKVTVKVKVTNRAGHKLPTGFAEGRQMWIHIKAVDANDTVVFEDGALSGQGYLVRTPETKVYEQVALAEGYPFLDANGDGKVSHAEKEFHFVLMNTIEKDNRIPPRGYKKAAYTTDGAFIIPRDPKDTDYADGQHWDITPYTFSIPLGAKGAIRVTATLQYQTFSREYIEFLRKADTEPTKTNGGRARDLPNGPGTYYGKHRTWGSALHQLWQDAEMGPAVNMGAAKAEIPLK